MRICMVTDNYYPYIGGIAEHVYFLAVELRKRGHIVKVLTARIGGRMMESMAEMPGEEHVKRIGEGWVVRSNKSFARVSVAWRPTAQIRKYFDQERLDVVHIHGSLAPTLPMAAIQASRTLNVVTFHAGHDQSLGYALFRSELRPYFNAVQGLIAVSETARISCAKYFPGPYRIIPNGIDLTFFRPDAGRVPGTEDGRPRILFVGRFEPRKGLKHLLTAMPEIVKHVPNVELVVVGTGLLGYSYKSYLSPEVQQHVRWAGLVQNEERPKYYASCDVYCSPATGQESFGIVLLEAMATGKPVVASDIDGYRSVMTDNQEGLMVPPGDPPALAQAIVRILLDREAARRFAANGLARAQQFSWPKLAERVEAYYEELAREYPVPKYGRKGAEMDTEKQRPLSVPSEDPLEQRGEVLYAESEIAETVATAARTKGKNQLWSVLKNGSFQIFSWSQAVSLFGDKLNYMALLAMIAFYAGKYGWESSRAISYLSVIVAMPVVLFGPLAGILVDRWDRRKVMIVCDSARTILVLSIPLVAIATSNLILIYAVAFLVFLCGLFFNTSRMSIIPNLVGSDHLLGANSFMSFVGRVATFLGMFLGGLIVDWKWWSHIGIKPAWTAGFYIDALTYSVSVIALLVIFKRMGQRRQQGSHGRREAPEVKLFITQQARMVHEVREAFNLVRGQPSVLFVYCSVLMMVILGAAVFVLYIPIIQSAKGLGSGLGLGTQGVGFVGAIGSVGLVLSSMGYGLLGHKLKKHTVMLSSFLVLGLVGAGLAVSKSFAPVAPLVFIAGLALSPVYIGMDTLLHESVPEAARGRIFSTRDWLLHLAFAVSALVIGQLTNFASTRRLLFGVSLLIAVMSVVGFFLVRGKKVG